eukprot:jgi/Botrbrau1/1183/Bobra.0162s0065.2
MPCFLLNPAAWTGLRVCNLQRVIFGSLSGYRTAMGRRKDGSKPTAKATKGDLPQQSLFRQENSANAGSESNYISTEERNFWLFKSEPHKFSWDDLLSSPNSTAPWDGVRNHVAKNNLLAMKVGDKGFFYHSSCKVPGIVGVVEVVKQGYPDHTSWDANSEGHDPKSTEESPRWYMVDVKSVQKLHRLVSLPELRTHSSSHLKNMQLFSQGRLSVQKVGKEEWDFIIELSQGDDPLLEHPEGSARKKNRKRKKLRGEEKNGD